MKNLLDKILIMVLAGGLGLLAQAAAPTMFVDSLDLKVGNITDGTKSFEGLPVLIKVFESDEKFPGFMISRSGGIDGDGTDIRFSQDNEILPHEMLSTETDAEGKKIFSFWVRVPEVTKGSTITMHWGVKEGQRPPVNSSTRVWRDYVGVWHDAPHSAKSVKDASGNHHDLSRGEDGNLSFADYLSYLGAEHDFTLTGYYIGDGVENFQNQSKNVVFGNWNKLSNANGRGWGMDAWLRDRLVFRASAGGDDYSQKNLGYNVLEKESFLAYVGLADTNYWGYVNGDLVNHSNGGTSINHEGLSDMRIALTGWSAREVRLTKLARSSDWVQEEYLAMSNENYVTLADDAQHMVAEGENYWIRPPSLYPLAFSDPSNIRFDVGLAKFGGPSPTSYSVQNAAGTKTFSGGFADLADPDKNPAGKGAYRVVITTGDTDSDDNPVKRLQKIIYFAYVDEVKSQDLRGNQAMLFNDIASSDKLTGQGFGYEGSGWTYLTASETNETEVVDRICAEHLVHQLGWRIRYGEIGSALSRDNASSPLDKTVNYLPFGTGVGALSYWNPAQEAKNLSDAGAAILYNCSDLLDPASVYSPIYDNGVGEVYFDAVNMDAAYRNRLELQYLTLSDVKRATGNVSATMSDITETIWSDCKHVFSSLDILVIKEGEKTNTWTNRSYVPLMMTQNGDEANTKSFYRVRAKLNKTEPIIFRIARTDSSWGAGGLTGPGKILVDNVLVSDPTTVVKLHRLEDTWDSERDFGKHLHGDRGTLSTRFPKVGDENVRAKVRVTYEGFGSDNLETRTQNVAALVFKYRRRYLNANLGEAGEWKSVRMECASDDLEFGSIFMTPASESLDLGRIGESPFDIEYRFEYTPNPTGYDYVDYFGLGLEGGGFVATEAAVSDPLEYCGEDEGISETPALGNDFFIRLREGSSDYGQMEVIWKLTDDKNQSLGIVTNNLHIIEDNLWTGSIAVTNANARLGFKIRGVDNANGTWNSWHFQDVNVDEADPTRSEKISPYSVVSDKKLDDEEEGEFKNIAAEVVMNTRQFVIRFNDKTGAFSLCRGDYQDFNHWTDAAANTNGLFVAHSGQVGDDGVVIPIANSILQQRFPKDVSKNVFADWEENVSSDPLWQEPFISVWNADEEARTGTTLLGTTIGERTPNNGWLGRNFMYVNESLNNRFSSSYDSRAALLEGRGRGSLECDETTRYPDGIGEINFDARLGQQHTYDRISTYQPNGDDFNDKDYLVSTRVVMSSQATSATDLGFDGQGTVSIFAYHNANGAYEFRMKRRSRGELELGLYRWYQEKTGAPLKVKELNHAVRNATGYESDTASGRVPGTTLCSTKLASDQGENTTAYVAFLSVRSIYEEQDGKMVYVGNQLYAGFTNNNGSGGSNGLTNHPSVSTDIDTEMTWHSFYAQDKGFNDANSRQVKPLRSGTFGFLSTDCPARFMRPQVHDALGTSYNKGKNVAYSEKITLPDVREADGNTYCVGAIKDSATVKSDFFDHWYVAPSSDIGSWEIPAAGKVYFGIVTPEVKQKIVVSTRPKASSTWTKFKEVEVSSFNYSRLSIPAHTTTPTCVRLATYDGGDDSPRCDVIVDNIEMTQWHATSTENLSSSDNDKFVFTGVWTESVKDAKKAEFWPLRVATNELQTIRSPYLENGIGSLSFTYDLETLDEHAELVVEYVSGDDLQPYNVVSYTNNANNWKQYGKNYSYQDLVEANGRITINFKGLRGKHSLVRLRVPQTVIGAAHNDTDYGEYGRIDIKSIVVWDEPNVDERSWLAWNVRVASKDTAAKEYGAYDKLLNIDSWLDPDGNSGMSMELNNGVDNLDNELAEDNPEYYGDCNPYIQSPALAQDSDLTVGEINFRARKSGYQSDDAVIGVYAVKRLADQENEEIVERIAITNLTSTAWQNITIKNKESGAVAIRLEVMDKDENGNPIKSDRVLFDELSVTERVDPNVVITFARPFRSELDSTAPVASIELPEEQPLCNEEWGIQCELALRELEKVIIPESIEVWCDYYIESFYNLNNNNWGYDSWKDIVDSGKRGTIKLSRAMDVVDSSRLIYRMTRSLDGDVDDYIGPIEEPNTVVQYNLRVTFKTTRDESPDEIHNASQFNPLDINQWTTPRWYYPLDLNKEFSGRSAYTIIDKISPKRAWINEVNAWDGVDNDNLVSITNSWVEIAIPSDVDMSGWRLEAVSTSNGKNKIMTYPLMHFGNNCERSLTAADGKPFAFYVVANKQSPVPHNAVMNIPTYADLGYSETIFESGMALSYWMPYALRLVRPTGIVDHEILVGAGNSIYDDLEDIYEDLTDEETGHNMTVKAGMDNYADFKDGKSVTLSMLNISNTANLEASGSWDNKKIATPGAINTDQVIADGYMIYPNDNTLRIICSVRGEAGSIEQDIGNGKTVESQLTTIAKNSDDPVTVWYYLAPWYEIEAIYVNGRAQDLDDGSLRKDSTSGAYIFTYKPDENTTIEAVSRTNKRLLDELINTEDKYKNGNPYKDAILDWLREKYPDLTVDDLKNGLTKVIGQDYDSKHVKVLSLTEMYWIGADPTPSTPEWKLKFYFASSPKPPEDVLFTVVDENGNDYSYTMSVVKMKLHVEYTNGTESKPIEYLASKTYGITSANWKGEATFSNWTSNGPTFQVLGALQVKNSLIGNLDLTGRYLPIKSYVLNENSFPAPEYERELYIPDPFGMYSITGAHLGWGEYWEDETKTKRPQVLWSFELGEREEKLPGYTFDYLR